MKKFSNNINESVKNWSFKGNIEIEGIAQGKTREEAMKTIDSYLSTKSGKNGKYKVEVKETKLTESYSFAIVKNTNVSIGIYAYTTGKIDFWKMLDSGTGSPIELAVNSGEPLDKTRPYLFSWINNGPYATPVDLEQIQWIL